MQKSVTKDKEGYDLLINGTIQQGDVIFLNIYALNIEVPTFTKQTLQNLKE
jgi:hypothetical protein